MTLGSALAAGARLIVWYRNGHQVDPDAAELTAQVRQNDEPRSAKQSELTV
jgi:hypothetical protein